MGPIQALPPDVAAQLKSSVNIVSLNDAVLGLIKNSLDANSTRIHVDVDFSRGSCNVEDDGEGIAALEFLPDGGLGLPFHTSKYHSATPQHGSTGVFLASLGGISVLTIYSRRVGEHERSCLLLYQSQRLPAHGIPAAHQQLRSRRHGTRVSVQDLFGSMPVRVKQRPSGDEGKLSREKMWKSLCIGCFAVLLACGANVSVSMQSQDKDQLLRLRPLSVDRPVASSPATSFDAATSCNLLSQILGPNHHSWASWVQTAANDDDISVRGLVCKRGSPSRDTQFLALGIHPLLPDGDWALLFERINRVFTASSFGSQETPVLPVSDRRCLVQLDHDADKSYRYPMFYVKIEHLRTGPKPYPETSHLRTRSAAKIEDMIEAMMIGFLKNQGYQPKKRIRREAFEPTASSPPRDAAEMSKSGRSHEDAAWSRMKQGATRATHRVSKRSTQAQSAGQSEQGADETFSIFDETEALALCREIEPIMAPSGDSLVSWVDPRNGERLRVNDRTGMVEKDPDAQTQDKLEWQEVVPQRKRLILADNAGNCTHGEARGWADNFAECWHNPVFNQREEAILTINENDESLERLALFQQSGIEQRQAIHNVFKPQSTPNDSRITREDLQVAKIIGQVDCKFILATAEKRQPSGSEARVQTIVFIIDQHAADERVRVEALLEGLCHPLTSEQQPIPEHPYPSRIATVRLEKPLGLAVSIDEAKLFKRHAPHFAAWGILYLVSETGTTEGAISNTRSRADYSSDLVVLTLPSVIAERCRVDLNLLRNFLIKEVWTRDEEGFPRVSTDEALASAELATMDMASKRKQWLHSIHNCPKGLLDMINSRSCRSAIMFNDELTLQQCQDLVMRLSNCVFPFQCAHGRPSMLPLSTTDIFGSTPGDHQGEDFARAYSGWK